MQLSITLLRDYRYNRQHNDIQPNRLNCDNQHKNIQHLNVVILSNGMLNIKVVNAFMFRVNIPVFCCVITLSFIMLNIAMLSVFTLSDIMQSIAMRILLYQVSLC
jgi:hypothetical protein